MQTIELSQRFRLSPSVIAQYFKHRCDRLFRWNTVEAGDRGKAGIGWNVPRRRLHSRPGISLLMEAGDRFEVEQLKALIAEVGEAGVLHAGIDPETHEIGTLPLSRFLEACRKRPWPRYMAQVELDLNPLPDWEAGFLQRFNLNPDWIKVGKARLDLIEVIPSEQTGDVRLRVWDFKASQDTRHEHFIQVAYYVTLLHWVIEQAGIANVRVDLDYGLIHSRKGPEEFELEPYLSAIEDFLRNRMIRLLDIPAADAHFHVEDRCALCDYMATCKDEADASDDLSRIPYMRSESKRSLRAARIYTHRNLAVVSDPEVCTQLKTRSHDLSVHLDRYVAAAQALEDGRPRPLTSSTLLMPRYEDIRVVLSAEQDAVTGTCFALGLKTFEGWDEARNRPLGQEQVFVSPGPEQEGEMLLAFLQALNQLLIRTDSANRDVDAVPVDEHPDLMLAQADYESASEALKAFRKEHKYIPSLGAAARELRQTRAELIEAEKTAKRTLRETRKTIQRERFKAQKKLHFYLYDHLDLMVLQKLMERHLFDEEPPEMLEEIRTLIRLFPPESVLPDAESFRSIPGTIVTEVLRMLVALPVPYLYDLRTVSERFQVLGRDGQERGFVFRPRNGFGWEHSNQVAFERIHDVWKHQSFKPDSRNPERVLNPDQILELIQQTVRHKLRATDSVIRRIKQDMGEQLLLWKEPFRLYAAFDPLDFRMLEALRIFTMMETSFEELSVKHLHTLPIADRAARFECIQGLRYISEGPEQTLWFSFDPESRDAKFDVGEFNLVLTPERQPELLLGEIDGLFRSSRWRHAPYQVAIEAYDLECDPPQICLRPNQPEKFSIKMDLMDRFVLDRVYVDYNSARVLGILSRLQEAPSQTRHLHELIASGTVADWRPVVPETAPVEQLLRQTLEASKVNPDRLLNEEQWRAWRGVFREPLTMIWGPPGTGKTHTLAHILIGYVLAARHLGRPINILITAFTHHAVVNVLKKVAELVDRYQLDPDAVDIFKAVGQTPHKADTELPIGVHPMQDDQIGHMIDFTDSCLIVGATVWATYKAMNAVGDPVQAWYDVILIDEASQLKLPDALIALSAGKRNSNIILAGDDRQLPPIIHGTYPEEHEYLLTSVFAFMRSRMEARQITEADIENRMLFQLEWNFRMNQPLTAYPRDVLYGGRFFSKQPALGTELSEHVGDDPLASMLRSDRPVVLCRYTPPRSFTARNPIEAELVARLTHRLSTLLIDDETGLPFTPDRFAQKGLAVLAPHRAQNSSIRHALAELGFGTPERPMPLVDTVDKLQGQERDVVLVSYGVADEEYAEAEAAFLLSRNRFNVAATRARQKLIVFCSDPVLDVVPTDRMVLLDAMMLKEFRRYCSDGMQTIHWESSEYGAIELHVQWKGFSV